MPLRRPFREAYGAGALHLLAAIASLAAAGYALVEIGERSAPLNFALWFGFAIVAHDLIAFPLYSALGAIAGRALLPAGDIGRMALNHVRVPVILSVIALIVWLPLILALDEPALIARTGLEPADYFGRWLLLTAALFGGSGLLLAIRVRRRRRRPPPARAAPG